MSALARLTSLVRGGRRKRRAELAYWRERLGAGGELGHGHYEHLFTTLFGIERAFYAGRSILDVGCGPRGSLEWAHDAAERVGLDPLADDYRELGTDAHAMRYVAAPAERMPFDNARFDVVSLFNALDHVDDVDRAIAEVKRVVKSGGLVLLIVEVGGPPTATEPHELGWDVVDRFAPELRVAEERRFERSRPGVYDSVFAAVPFDTADRRPRPGILAANLDASERFSTAAG